MRRAQTTVRAGALALLALACASCAAGFRMPMTAADLARYDSGPALVAYLGQPDASPAVCDLRALTPHPSSFNAQIREQLVDAFVEGKVPPALWRRCIDALAKGLEPADAALLFDRVLRAYANLLEDDDLAGEVLKTDRLNTLHRLYLERPAGLDARPQVREALVAEIAKALARGKLAPLAQSFSRELLETLEVEQGRWQGAPVDLARMDALAQAGNEMTLSRFAERLPSAPLRSEAQRRLVRIHIALSPFEEVRAAAGPVEQKVMSEGHNRIDLRAHPVVRAWFDPEKMPVRGVMVQQDIWQHAATLLACSTTGPGVSVLPAVSFRGSLLADVQGVSRSVSLCERARELDPTPCISIADVSLDNPLAYLDQGGEFHFNDKVAMSDVVPMASRSFFLLPVSIGGKPAALLQWGLTFHRPDDLIFYGGGAGGRGPELNVQVDLRNPRRYIFAADGGREPFTSVVDAEDILQYRVGSSGASGSTGSAGSTGSPGASGNECQNGSDGGPGGPGGPGGSGGDGGNVLVGYQCGPDAAPSCDSARPLLNQIFVSYGGPGGAGGPGGSGGAGGAGGAGRSPTTHIDSNGNTVTDDPGCSPGMSGNPGATGASGPQGAPGRAGRVRLERR